MGTVHKFKRPPKNIGQFGGYKPAIKVDPRQRRRSMLAGKQSLLVGAGWAVIIGSAIALAAFG